jgi:hypothetical protein
MNRVFIRGTAVERSWADRSKNLSEFIFSTVTQALKNSGTDIADVDSVIVAAHDLVDGRSLSSMVTAPAAGAYLKDEVRLGDDGAAALVVGAARVRSGASRCTLVAAWGRVSEGDPEAISNALFDPFFARPLGMTEVAVSALRASAALQRFPGYAQWREAAAERRPSWRGDAGRSGAPLPLRSAEVPVWGDVAAAVVLSAEPDAVEVLGVGMGTEPFYLGDRQLLDLPSLRQASVHALRMAGCSTTAVDVVEVDGLTLFDEALALEAVGWAEPGEGMRALATSPNVNAAGGYNAGYAAPAMGLVRICEATVRLQSSGSVALATGSSVVAAQTHTAVVVANV